MSRRRIVLLCIAVLIVAAVFFVMKDAASFLRVNAPQHADVMVVLGGGQDDSRYWRAVELLQAGYSNRILLDAPSFGVSYGKTGEELAQDWVRRMNAEHTSVCGIYHDSTYDEAEDVARCLRPMKVSSVMIVTSDYHTRRAFSIFKSRLPQYQWSVAATYAPFDLTQPQRMAGDDWWKNRRWAKTILDEYQRLIWWELVDRWRSGLVITS